MSFPRSRLWLDEHRFFSLVSFHCSRFLLANGFYVSLKHNHKHVLWVNLSIYEKSAYKLLPYHLIWFFPFFWLVKIPLHHPQILQILRKFCFPSHLKITDWNKHAVITKCCDLSVSRKSISSFCLHKQWQIINCSPLTNHNIFLNLVQ